MIRLISANEENFADLRALCVREDQEGYLDSAIGILARGYIYRDCRARVIGIADGDALVGVALVKDMDEEPACYDLQQFMIDARYQGRGFGTEALRIILSELCAERKYECVEVCVKKDDAAALRMYETIGFCDTGYIDDDAPDCLNYRYRFSDGPAISDVLISDFTDPRFQNAFKTYFSELGISVKDWDGLFREMNGEGTNRAFVRMTADGEVIGFIQVQPIRFASWFFEETCGFIREFWVKEAYRSDGHGAALLRLAEDWFKEQGIFTSILTTDTAERFYRKHGYQNAPGCAAKNRDPVLIKHLD